MGDDQFIKVYDEVASTEFCSRLIQMFHQSPHVRAGKTQDAAQVDAQFKDCDELFFAEVLADNQPTAERAPWQAIDDELFELINPLVSDYITEFRHLHGQELLSEGFRIKRYPRAQGRFNEHIDATPSTPTRVIALILYLNDVSEGGETEYPRQNVKVAPKTGRLAISPCAWTYPHRGNVPVSNDKYILNNFLFLLPRRSK